MPASAWYARVALTVLAVAGAVLVTPSASYADEVRNKQFSLQMLHAQDAWRHSRGDGAVVAVLDSGVDADHPDLKGQVLDGYNTVDENSDTDDVDGHGTAVAAMIAGRDDDSGVAGLAPESKILPVRVGGKRMYDLDIAEGIRWAVDHDASVINMSLGSERSSDVIADAVAYAIDHDVVVVAAAGNINERGEGLPISYPARLPGVVAVTGITPDAKHWHNSARGPRAALCAPATGVIAPYEGGYQPVSGTSFASPMVAAAAALVRAKWPKLSAPNVINRLLRTATDLGRSGRDSLYGYGRVDLSKALTADVRKVRTNPLTLGPGQDIAVPRTAKPGSKTEPVSGGGSGYGWAWALLAVLAVALVAAVVLTLLQWRRRAATAAASVRAAVPAGPTGTGPNFQPGPAAAPVAVPQQGPSGTRSREVTAPPAGHGPGAAGAVTGSGMTDAHGSGTPQPGGGKASGGRSAVAARGVARPVAAHPVSNRAVLSSTR